MIPVILISLLFVVGVDADEPLQSIYRANGRFTTANQWEFAQSKKENLHPVFRAIVTNSWLPGLVPIFAIERKGQFTLRRLPPGGQANITEPLFFALIPEDESDALRVAGRWKCEATRGDATLVYPDFEIACDGPQVAARFDQSSEYRFAFISSGSFLSNRLDLKIENVNDHYRMAGEIKAGILSGTWNSLDRDEKGTWTAVRDLPRFVDPEPSKRVQLYEWKSSGGEIRYEVGEQLIPGFVRSLRPLCRVWLVK